MPANAPPAAIGAVAGLHEIRIKLAVTGPLMTESGAAPPPGIDAAIARDGVGRVMLPYSLVKGKVLEAARVLEQAGHRPLSPSGSLSWVQWAAEWLGQKSHGAGFDPDRGRLVFGDFITSGAEAVRGQPETITRIHRDAASGTVEARMLAVLEAPFSHGQPLPFEGRATFVGSDAEARDTVANLLSLLAEIRSFGAERTVGFGRHRTDETTCTLVAREKASAQGKPPSPSGATCLRYRLSFDRPLCVVGRRFHDNHFESLESIPGGVIRGSVARLLLDLAGSPKALQVSPSDQNLTLRFPVLADLFSSLRFSEARPVDASATPARRPVEPPLSAVVVPGNPDSWYDVAMVDGPVIVDGKAPAFAPDMDSAANSTIRATCGWPDVPRAKRVRTAIDPDRLVGLDGMLFSYGTVLPEARRGNGTSRIVWEGEIGLEDADLRAVSGQVQSELQEALHAGLPNVGKTKAVAGVEWLPGDKVPAIATDSPRDPRDSELVFVTLQTDCLMPCPESAAIDLRAAYEKHWHAISGGCLTLERFFARQTLRGGPIARSAHGGRYRPFLLTERGSVFVLRASEAGLSLLAEWHRTGLPDAPSLLAAYGADGADPWMRCPYLRHSGHGEIAVDVDYPCLPEDHQ